MPTWNRSRRPPSSSLRSQDLKELLDFVTKAGDGIDTGLIQIGVSATGTSTNLGALDDQIRHLSPENLETVKQLAIEARRPGALQRATVKDPRRAAALAGQEVG